MYPVKIEFKEYPSGSWEDWSEYLAEVPDISIQVESDNPGEAGAIVFDSAKVSFRHEIGNPVYQKFSVDLTSVQRYLFRISILKSDGSYQIKFEGIADFSSIQWNEYENVITFSIVDKLSALNLLTAEQCRLTFLIKDRLSSSSPWSTGFEFQYHNDLPNAIWISGYHPEIYDDLTSVLVYPGEVIDIPEVVGGQSRMRVITKSYLAQSPNHGKIANYVEFTPRLEQTNYNVIKYEYPGWLEHRAYKETFYNIDINNIVDNELVSLDGFKIIKALYNQAWPGTTLILRPSNLSFNVPVEYAVRLIENNPFGKTPFEALVTLINSVKPSPGELSGCYVYVDDSNNLVIQSRQYLTSGTQRTIGNTKILNQKRKYFWDKLADGATVNLKTWVTDSATGKYIEAKGTATLRPPGATGYIKPKNEIKKDIITIELPELNEDPKEFFAQKALELAQDILNFYGKRRESIEFTFNLDDNTINWNILDYLNKDAKNYFFTKLNIDPLSRQIDIEAVEVTGSNFDPRLTIFPLSDSNLYNSSSDYTVQYLGGITGGGTSYDFLQPLELNLGQVKLNYTDNLKLTDNKLDTAQPIKTTDTPTFNQVNLSTAGTLTQAVRGDRTIATSYPLTGGGDLTADRTFSLNYNSTNLKLTSNALNTIQDIATTSTPTFNQINLSADGTITQAVRGGRLISTSAPLTGGGDLTANRTIALSYNTTNLKLTSNALNTIQDIATTSSPTFSGLTITNRFDVTSSIPSFGISTNEITKLVIYSNQINSSSDSSFDVNGAYIRIGDPLVAKTFTNQIGIKFLDAGVSHLSLVWSSSNQKFFIGRSSSVPYLTPVDTGYDVFTLDIANKRLGINQSSPSYTLDITGTGRFTQDLRLDSLLKQVGSTGINEFNTDVEQKGNKSYYNSFTSGWTGSGWRLDYGITDAGYSHLELDNLTVRGTMRVYEFIVNQIRATNGSLFVSSSAKVLSRTLTPGDPEIYTIVFEDPEGLQVTPFAVNDILIVQRVRLDSTTIIKRIVLQVTSINQMTVIASVIYRLGTIEKGDLAVRIGNTSSANRQGSIYLTSDDSNAPYIDIVDGVNSWSTWGSQNKLRVRLGKLTGVTDSFFGGLSGYGLYAKSNAYLRGKIYAEEGGWIAGWSINAAELVSPTITDGNGNDINLKLTADSGSEAIGIYLNYDIQANGTPFFLSLGNIKDGAGNYTRVYGISFRQGSSNLFELSNNTLQIAGWNFDDQKFYKGTNIELNSSNKTIGVNSNKVKLFYTDSSNWGIEGRDAFNNLVFQLGSTNKISNWTFINEHIYRLQSGTPTSSPSYGLTISSTSTANVVIAYGSNYQRYVKFGYQTSGNWFGIEGTDVNANIVFQLGSINKICGWNFDTTKFSNDVVSLEASAAMKGLVVDTDRIKIGKFTTSTITNTYSDITTYLLNGYSGISNSDTWWASYGQTLHTQSSTSQIYLSKSSNTLYHYVDTDGGQRATDIDELTYGTIHRLFDDVKRVRNRKLKFEFKLRGIKFATGTYHNLYGTVNIIYFNSSFGILKREQILYFQLLEANVPGIGYSNALVIDKTGSNAIEWFIPANIPDLTYLYIEFTAGFLVGGQYRRALDFEVSDLKFYGFEKAKTHINEDGIEIYNSDQNYFRFKGSDFIVNAYDIRIAGYPIPRFMGKYSSAPTTSVQVGDIYINSTDNNIYMCYSFNSATPLWKRINYN